jgi:carboxypeptidase Q
MAGLNVDGTRYFWYHHTHSDTVDKLDRSDVEECAKAMAILVYAAADIDANLRDL